MTAATRALLVSFWILAVGLTAVLLEVEDVRAGVRIRSLLIEKDSRIERFRWLELRFNRMASPDLLQKRLPEDFREPVVESKDRKPRVQG